jgi:hypothetical protein
MCMSIFHSPFFIYQWCYLVSKWALRNLFRFFLAAFTVKGASRPKVQVLSKDYVFSSLKHGFHVLNKAHYRIMCQLQKFNSYVFPWIFKQYVITSIFNYKISSKSSVYILTKIYMSIFFKQYMFQTFNDTLDIEFIKTYLCLTSFQIEHNIFTKKKVILYNTFNIHENVTLPLPILIYIFFFEKVLQIM